MLLLTREVSRRPWQTCLCKTGVLLAEYQVPVALILYLSDAYFIYSELFSDAFNTMAPIM
jgi:hypothetical protein